MNQRRFKNISLIVLGVFFNFTMAGVIFGFTALKAVLIQDRVYAERCRDMAPCKEQASELDWMFTVATTVTNAAALPIGFILDRAGPKISGIIGSVLFLFGNLGFAWADSQSKHFLGILKHGLDRKLIRVLRFMFSIQCIYRILRPAGYRRTLCIFIHLAFIIDLSAIFWFGDGVLDWGI